MKNLILILILIAVSANLAFAQQVLVWDFSGSYTIPNPDVAEDYEIEVAVLNALEANEIEHELVYNLPDDLSMYDAVFVLTGIWCFS